MARSYFLVASVSSPGWTSLLLEMRDFEEKLRRRRFDLSENGKVEFLGSLYFSSRLESCESDDFSIAGMKAGPACLCHPDVLMPTNNTTLNQRLIFVNK
mmetsp:Transcript_26652/g.53123  ORF Transcript_26652/g.53123 Transcript_26652/m.53123 type:complete len:99 (-) Transcript_26652:124-420(-)